ncbi:MAG: DJ-1/PfpI family protein [Desulfovibrio sp.]|jgi:cyclohexyl-isocyanide hydratase|nr:DJ-1/PfpI family protein [Desulfovibrio sp.]
MSSTVRIGFLLFPEFLQLDFTGPYAVLAAGPGAEVHLIGKDVAPVLSSDNLLFTPKVRMDACPQLNVLCVPGGQGIQALLSDGDTLAFIRRQAENCLYLCSVCTGALVLGAAGLLCGYKVTTHWQSLEFLADFGAEAQHQRVVVDRNRISAAGVSAGIDMALTLAGMLWGVAAAQEIQLGMEYAPTPPYTSGSPNTAPPSVLAAVKSRTAARQEARREAVRQAAALLR